MAPKDKLPPVGHALSGAGGAILALTITYPLDIIKTRLQVQPSVASRVSPKSPRKCIENPLISKQKALIKSKEGSASNDVLLPKYKSSRDAFNQIIAKEGISGLYAGLPAGLLGTFSSNFTYFFWYQLIRSTHIRRSKSSSLSTVVELLIGALAGALSQLTTIPVSVVVTRQQTTPKESRKSFRETWWEIVNHEGWSSLWKGLKPSLVLVVNPAITYGLFEPFKKWVVGNVTDKGPKARNLTSWEIFMIGAASKTLATIITYPYIMAKVRLQWKPPKELESDARYKYKGAIDVLKKVFRNDGLRGWYKGMQTQIFKAVLSQALLFMIKDQLDRYTLLIFILAKKFLKRK